MKKAVASWHTCFNSQNDKEKAVQINVFPENARARKCYEGAGFEERETFPDAFKFKDELWGRCNMVIKNEKSDK